MPGSIRPRGSPIPLSPGSPAVAEGDPEAEREPDARAERHRQHARGLAAHPGHERRPPTRRARPTSRPVGRATTRPRRRPASTCPLAARPGESAETISGPASPARNAPMSPSQTSSRVTRCGARSTSTRSSGRRVPRHEAAPALCPARPGGADHAGHRLDVALPPARPQVGGVLTGAQQRRGQQREHPGQQRRPPQVGRHDRQVALEPPRARREPGAAARGVPDGPGQPGQRDVAVPGVRQLVAHQRVESARRATGRPGPAAGRRRTSPERRS